jgi:hypothetical protein
MFKHTTFISKMQKKITGDFYFFANFADFIDSNANMTAIFVAPRFLFSGKSQIYFTNI